MAGVVPINPKNQFFDSEGVPLAGGSVTVYLAGTTTKTATYQDKDLTTANTNPITLDAAGRCSIWASDANTYKYVVADASGAVLYTEDNIPGADAGLRTDLSSSGGAALVGFIQSGTGAVARSVQGTLRETIGVTDFVGTDTTGASSSVPGFQAAIDSTPDSGVQVIRVPRGTYAGDMSTLNYGSRVVVWEEEGGVTYSTTAPSVASCVRLNAFRAGDATRPWVEGRVGVHSGTAQTSASNFANFRVDRLADYTGTASGVTHAARVETTVSSGVGTAGTRKPEWALTAKITNNSNNCNAVALTGQAVRDAAVDAPIWSAQINSIDNRANTAGVTYVVRGFEANIQANGADSTNTRSVGDFIAHSLDGVTYSGGADNIGYGARVYSATADFKIGFATQSNGSSKVITGFQNGASGTTGYRDIGTWSSVAMSFACTAPIGIDMSGGTYATCAMRLGTDKKVELTNSGSAWISRTTASNGVEIGDASAIQVKIGSGVQIGSPALGGYKGAGTINMQGDIYKSNTAYTNPDYVFEYAYTGQVVKFADKEGAAEYVQRGGRMSLDDLREHTKTTLRLPGITDEPAGMFKRGDLVLEKLEELTLYVLDLHERIKSLEAKA